MPVQLIVDCFGVDDTAEVIVEPADASIDAARHAIYHQLRSKDDTLLRLHLNHPALFKHFREFESQAGFTVQRLMPRLLLAERFKTVLPAWLTDDWIVALGLLKKPDAFPELIFEDQFLIACHPDLVNGSDFPAFIAALTQQAPVFLSVLAEDTITSRLAQHLHADLAIDKASAVLFISQLQHSTSISVCCQQLAYQQYLLHLRRFVSDYQLTLALPAQALPSDVLTAVPLLPLQQAHAQQLPALFLSVLNAISQQIITQHQPPDSLARLLVVDWDSVVAELSRLTVDHCLLISAALVEQLQSLGSTAAQALADQLGASLTAHCHPPLSTTASVHDALAWSEGYFAYLRPVLLNKQTPDESINASFTVWLLAQSARIARSNADWRYCAKQIDTFLAQNYLVVVIMVDALSALNQDLLLAELASFECVTRTDDMLFAPLPTLTEVGKMAVLTGKHSHLLPSDSEAAVRQTYAAYLPETHSLKVIKSWQDASQHIAPQTNLVVFFENRLDDWVHKSVNYPNYREEIKPTLKQLKGSIQSWLKDALSVGRDVVFFITADHGMTVTQGTLQGNFDEIKDRAIKIQPGDRIAEDFVRIQQDSKAPYAIVKTRHALSKNTALAHGGLTPEEVLIPFITLTTRPPKPNAMPVQATLIGNCSRLGNKYWQLELRLTAVEQVETLRLSLEPPFKLEQRPPIDIIRAENSVDIILKFTTDCEQNGLIALDLQLNYDKASVHEKNNHRLEVDFPPSLLKRDADTQKLDGAFDE